MALTLSHTSKKIKGSINLTASKSIANRVLIIKALCADNFNVENLATAKDTATLNKLLFSNEEQNYDVGHAGTVMRFLTAFLAFKEGKFTITGSERMQQRPIKVLVDALRELGAKIEYLKNEGYPPLKITGGLITGNKIEIDGGVSSQYISALMLIAPKIKGGLTIQFKNEIISKPYINMTLEIMKDFGADLNWIDETIVVKEGNYIAKDFVVEADWSSASYWYGIAALANEAEINLYGLSKNSLQGDAVVQDIYKKFGVNTEFIDGGVKLTKTSTPNTQHPTLKLDFENCPDIAQTVAVTCAVLNIEAKFTGLKTLRIKETDRIFALQQELTKLDFNVEVEGDDLILNPSLQAVILNTFCGNKSLEGEAKQSSSSRHSGESRNLTSWSNISIDTYDDHRMAMAFAPLALINPITINNENVVVKSYPDFWKDLKGVGFKL
jgi:3-phosphoshikimate 1-carboxyvinyltransferase